MSGKRSSSLYGEVLILPPKPKNRTADQHPLNRDVPGTRAKIAEQDPRTGTFLELQQRGTEMKVSTCVGNHVCPGSGGVLGTSRFWGRGGVGEEEGDLFLLVA